MAFCMVLWLSPRSTLQTDIIVLSIISVFWHRHSWQTWNSLAFIRRTIIIIIMLYTYICRTCTNFMWMWNPKFSLYPSAPRFAWDKNKNINIRNVCFQLRRLELFRIPNGRKSWIIFRLYSFFGAILTEKRIATIRTNFKMKYFE